ncbi:hypothetical protein M0R36_05035 [bacterium]|jgi:phosphomevalonate kinase|nr:hypothetical protein [bacterium]
MRSRSAFLEILAQNIGDKHPYSIEAYNFVIMALAFARKKIGSAGDVPASEFIKALGGYAEREFGPMARKVLEHWGLKSFKDFGEIVFNMSQWDLLEMSGNDKIEEFLDAGDFKF